MKTIKDLTPEIRGRFDEYKARARNFYNGKDCSQAVSKKYIEYVYELANQKKPVVIFAENPLQYKLFWSLLKRKDNLIKLIYLLKNKSKIGDNKELHNELYNELDNELDNELRKELYKELHNELRNELRNELDNELRKELNEELKQNKIRSHYLFLSDFYTRCYLTWYRFISHEFNIDHPKKQVLNNLYWLNINSDVSRCYFTKGYCLVLKLPKKVNFNNSDLHNEHGPAIQYKGGYNMYYWKGYRVSEKLIMNPDAITKQDVLAIDNAELRRCYIDKLGVTRFYELLSDGDGLHIIDEDTDHQGHKMKLMLFDFMSREIQVLEVVDPSTGRTYNLYPPDVCRNVWDAKKSTFNNYNLAYRQGDVGIVDINNDFDKPLIET